MTYAEKCVSLSGKHDYRPRFDEVHRDLPGGILLEDYTAREIRALMTLNIYVRDVCRGCGHTIERKHG